MRIRLLGILLCSGCSLLAPVSAWSANLVEYIILVSADFHQTETSITNVSAPRTLGLLDGANSLSCRLDPSVRYVLFKAEGLPLRGEANLLPEQGEFVFEEIHWNWLPKADSDERAGTIVANGQDLGEVTPDALGRLKLLARLKVQCQCTEATCTNAPGGGIYNNPGTIIISTSTVSNGETVGQSVSYVQPTSYQIISQGR